MAKQKFETSVIFFNNDPFMRYGIFCIPAQIDYESQSSLNW